VGDVTLVTGLVVNFATSTVGGNLNVTAAGITQSAGNLTVGGITMLNAGANVINLADSSNDFSGTVSVVNSGANDAILTASSELELGDFTVGGMLFVSAGGNITQIGDIFSQNGSVEVTGLSIFMAENVATVTPGGDIFYTSTGVSDLAIGLLNAGDALTVAGAFDQPPATGIGGTVSVSAAFGNIVGTNAVADVNVRGQFTFLQAVLGSIGTADSPIKIIVPFIPGKTTIKIDSLFGAYIFNPLGALVEIVSGSVTDSVRTSTAVAAATGAISALQDVGYIDWVAFSPAVRLFDCLEPCVSLPADQLEDEYEYEYED
jgi:hypothetical protein